MTEEHIYGKWVKKLIPSTHKSTLHRTFFLSTDLKTQTTSLKTGKGRLNRNGSAHAHQLRIVCKNCNNQWMSEIQKNAAIVLSPVINGVWEPMSEDAMAAVAAYATMVTMVLEYSDPNTITATQSDRLNFMVTRKPGINWQIYLGLCKDNNHSGAFWHRGVGVDLNAPPTMQTTTFYLGRCFIHTMSGPEQYMPDPVLWAKHLGIRRMWPNPETHCAPPLIYLETGVGFVASTFWKELGITDKPLGDMSEFPIPAFPQVPNI